MLGNNIIKNLKNVPTFINRIFSILFLTELNEDWAFAINLKDFAEIPEENEIDNDSPLLDMFQVKFLGSLEVESPKSEQETAAAIKKIVSQSKGLL